MIVAERNANVFEASEELLFVPISVGDDHKPTSGFAMAVEECFPTAATWLQDRLQYNPLRFGEVHTFEGGGGWLPAYALMFAGIHAPGERGWEEAPAAVEIALYQAPARRLGHTARIAVAGIPGTGFSGIKGNADPDAIRASLMRSEREVVVYHHNSAGDREPRSLMNTPPTDRVAVPLTY